MVFNKMKFIYKRYIFVCALLVFIGKGYVNQYFYVYNNLIIVSWGDGPYGKKLYGAYVYKGEEIGDKVQVKLMIYINHQNFNFISYYMDFGVIGIDERNKVYDNWSRVDWRPEGVYIGNTTARYFISKADLAKHR